MNSACVIQWCQKDPKAADIFVPTHTQQPEVFSLKGSKKYSEEHAQARSKKVKHFKSQLFPGDHCLFLGTLGHPKLPVSNVVISLSYAEQQVSKAHMKSSHGNSSETAWLLKNPIFFHSFFLCTLLCMLKTSALWASVIAKQTCHAILFYISVSSLNLKAL